MQNDGNLGVLASSGMGESPHHFIVGERSHALISCTVLPLKPQLQPFLHDQQFPAPWRALGRKGPCGHLSAPTNGLALRQLRKHWLHPPSGGSGCSSVGTGSGLFRRRSSITLIREMMSGMRHAQDWFLRVEAADTSDMLSNMSSSATSEALPTMLTLEAVMAEHKRRAGRCNSRVH